MDEIVVKLKAIALKHAEAMAAELVVEAVMPALKDVVAKSENKIDDAILLALEAPLKVALLDLISKISKDN